MRPKAYGYIDPRVTGNDEAVQKCRVDISILMHRKRFELPPTTMVEDRTGTGIDQLYLWVVDRNRRRPEALIVPAYTHLPPHGRGYAMFSHLVDIYYLADNEVWRRRTAGKVPVIEMITQERSRSRGVHEYGLVGTRNIDTRTPRWGLR